MTSTVDSAGRLRVGGVDLVDLAEQFGTPLFVYDEAHLRAQCREAVEAWGDGVAYATKAFLCMAMARLAYEEGMCLDVSTGGELHVALTAGVPAERLVLHGNNKSEEELAAALAAGVGRIVVDSFDEIDRIEGWTSASSPTGRSRPRPDRRRRRAPAQGAGPGHARGRGAHPRVRPHRTGRLQVRLRPGLGGGGACRRAAVRPRCRRGGGAGRHPCPPGQPGLRPGPVRPGHRGAGRVLRPPRPARAGGGRRPRSGLRQRRGGTPDGPVGLVGPPGVSQGRASPTRSGSPPSPGGPSWPRPASPCTGWGRSRRSPAIGPTSRWTVG